MAVNMASRRHSGTGPYWPPGTQIMWREGDGPLGTGPLVVDTSKPHFAEPVTVVSDDSDALVVWLPIGAPVLRAARADGKGKREDKSSLFTAAIVQDVGSHAYFDQVRVSPTGQAWSAWAFFAEGSRQFAGWYVNFEEPHVRDAGTIYTSDHVLDLWVEPDGTTVRKDEDELELAVEQGVLGEAKAAQVRSTCADVESIVSNHRSPFCDGWERFRPPSDWPMPALRST